MAKKQQGQPTPAEPGTGNRQLRLPQATIRMAKSAAPLENLEAGELVARLVREYVALHYPLIVERVEKGGAD